MIYVGIDPGATGAISFLAPVDAAWGERLDTKDGRALFDALQAAKVEHGSVHVAVEKVHSMPRQGVASSFKFGMAYGAACAVVQALGFPLHLVTPQAWYKLALDQRTKPKAPREKKAAVLASAQDRWPGARLGKGDGAIAEALWMAEWLRRELRS